MPFTIYMILFPDGRAYVGCTKRDALVRVRSEQLPPREWPGDDRASMPDALKRFGVGNVEVVELAKAATAPDAAAIETLMIERHQTLQPRGYNRRAQSGYRLSAVAA